MQALDERWAAGAEAESEAAIRRPLKAGRGHGDRRRRATPDREHRRGEPDSRGDSGDLRQQHHRILGPALGGAETGVSELLGTDGEADRRLGVGLEWRHAGANPRTGVSLR